MEGFGGAQTQHSTAQHSTAQLSTAQHSGKWRAAAAALALPRGSASHAKTAARSGTLLLEMKAAQSTCR